VKSPRIMTTLAVVGLTAAGLAIAVPAATASTGAGQSARPTIHRFCAVSPRPGYAACQAEGLVLPRRSAPAGPPSGALTPAGLQDAYNFTGLKSKGATVAIVDAFSYPNLEADLGVFRSYFGLPACTTKNGCLTIMNERGGSKPPKTFDVGWAGEQALDVDAVSSACPDCKIIVVQADTNGLRNLGKSVDTAAKQKGVVAISNSYIGKDASDGGYGTYYNHPGIAVTASSGDHGFLGGQYPASSHYVVGVGGTSLVKSSDEARGWTESVWSGAGSGCSGHNAAVKTAKKFDTGCGKLRAVSDVSAAANPNAGGLAWYGPSSETESYWSQVGGTSEASPIIASAYALSGDTKGLANEIPYENPTQFYDITSGSNGTCSPKQLCTARKGWDGPTGLGTPNGVKGI
jgi:subtilase family serine protease